MGTAIGYMDADTFYVSAERVRSAYLRGQPVGVLGNNGACVIARSYEMKAAGVRVGEPIWDAVRRCPQGIYLKRDFRWYEVLSRRMLDVMTEFSPLVEYYSIDEFAFRAERGGMAAAIRDRVAERTGLPVTVAVARTRTLAKLFCEQAKPRGAWEVLDPAEERDRLARLPVDAVAGIAGRRAARLEALGVRTCLDLCRLPRSAVRAALTVTGERIWQELNGTPALALEADKRPNQSVSRGGGFTATADPALLYAWLVRHVERLIEELNFHQARAGRLAVWVTYKDGPVGLGEGAPDSPSDEFGPLLDAARAALRQAWRPGEPANRMDIVATHLRGPGPVQRTLFETPDPRAPALADLKRRVNDRLGRFTLRSGSTLPLSELYRDRASSYDVCDVKGKIVF